MNTRRLIVFLFLFVVHFLLLIKLNFFANYISGDEEFLDFDSYYKLSSDIRIGKNPYKVNYMKTLGPPLVFVYYLPFSFLSLNTARMSNSWINIFAGYILCYLLARTISKKYKKEIFLFLGTLLFSSFTTRLSLGLGQPILLITLLIGATLIGRNKIRSGIFLSIASSIKAFLIFSYLSLLTKRKKVLYGALFCTLFLILLSLLFVKPEYYLFYLKEEFLRLLTSDVVGLDYYNQSLKSTFHRLFLENIYQIVYCPVLIIASVYVAFSASLEFGIITSLLLSPISWQHYYVILFPIYILLFKKVVKTGNFSLFILFILSILFWWIEFPFLHKAEISFFNGLLASHYFFAGFLLVLIIFINRRN